MPTISSDQTEKMLVLIRQTLSAYPDIHFATLFGSAATGRMTAGSDVDVSVAAMRPLNVERRGELATSLSLALGREVDLIDLQAVSGLILQQALCKGRILVNRDPELYARLIKRLWYNQSDMMPYTRRILQERNRRWIP